MTEYTREQIDKARQAADAVYDMAREADNDPYTGYLGDVWIDKFTRHLGLPIKPEKPTPGTIGVTHQGWPAYVSVDGVWMAIHPGGYPLRVHRNDPQPQPARVVPAEPPVLSEEQVGGAWDRLPGGFGRMADTFWAKLKPEDRESLMDFARDLLAKHVHAAPVELPTREQVKEAIAHAPRVAGRLDTTSASVAVMALLGGEQK